MDLRATVREEPGRGRSDLTRLLADPAAFGAALDRMAAPWRESGISKVAALDSMGFVFGGALARDLGVGLVLLRKGGRRRGARGARRTGTTAGARRRSSSPRTRSRPGTGCFW